MNLNLPFSEEQICGNCGNVGAYDLCGDYFCETCLKPESETIKAPMKVYPEIPWLGTCEICLQHGKAKDGKCVYCGSGPKAIDDF